MLALILHLDKKKSGIDSVPTEFMTRHGEWCSKCISVIFPLFLSISKITKGWKYAKIVPILKSCDPQNVLNYRHTWKLCEGVGTYSTQAYLDLCGRHQITRFTVARTCKRPVYDDPAG